jgi:hypothetical protein
MGIGKARHWFRLTFVALFVFLAALTTLTITVQLTGARTATCDKIIVCMSTRTEVDIHSA